MSSQKSLWILPASAKSESDTLGNRTYSTNRQGGMETEENLWLACRECNSHKSVKTYGFDEKIRQRIRLFNPHRQNWNRHFKFSKNKTEIIGKTACGRATIEALKLNNEILVSVRRLWVEFDLFPPKD